MIETDVIRPQPDHDPAGRLPPQQAWRGQIGQNGRSDVLGGGTNTTQVDAEVRRENIANGFPNASPTRRDDLPAAEPVNEAPPYDSSGSSSSGKTHGVEKGLEGSNSGWTSHLSGRALNGTQAARLDNDRTTGEEKLPTKANRFREGLPLRKDGYVVDAATGEQLHRHSSQLESLAARDKEREKVLKLSPDQIHELTSSPESLPIRTLTPHLPQPPKATLPEIPHISFDGRAPKVEAEKAETKGSGVEDREMGAAAVSPTRKNVSLQDPPVLLGDSGSEAASSSAARPTLSSRALSTPSSVRRRHSHARTEGASQDRTAQSKTPHTTPGPLHFGDDSSPHPPMLADPNPSPMPQSIPLPPLSIPTYLQLELSSSRPSPLYIHRSVTSDFPYESSRVKIERLLNFLLLPPQLEQVLWFGALACLDSWLYSFTILPIRFLKAVFILSQSWVINLCLEVEFVSRFIVKGVGRMWRRRRRRGTSASGEVPRLADPASRSREASDAKYTSVFSDGAPRETSERTRSSFSPSEPTSRNQRLRRHRRTKSSPSALLPDDKADILKGLLIIFTCTILMYFDASRMYHWIRGQAAIKLYVIYNVLEVGDRLFSALGQDVLECLFSREALERKPDGRSKVIRPFWLFLLALVYTVVHATALFYQVITLNVAVNSYSNALITLLMSNQFVEIKSTVFKKFEKENLFQLTCADVVERFQLWLMLTIIASRNIVETEGLNIGLNALTNPTSHTTTNASNPITTPPKSSSSILPKAFTLFPSLFSSWTAVTGIWPTIGHVLGPFLVVLGSEMLVDWLKHAYITKFNNTRPAIYGRFLDVLAKDYYSNAFADQNLTKRLGLPVIPLSCLFIRASVQTYHMFLAAWIQAPLLPSSSTSLSSVHDHYTTSPSSTSIPTTTAAALHRIDVLLRQSLHRASFSPTTWLKLTTILIFTLLFFVLLALKLVLGMVLLSFARARYRSMKEREKLSSIHVVEGGRRVGGWGVVEVDDDKRRWIYDGDAEGARALREREAREKERREKGNERSMEGVRRYEMVGKRIW